MSRGVIDAGASPRVPDEPAAARETAPAAPPARRLTYYPAIDGLRGLAVAAVLLFHGGVAWFPGGLLGVSTFFTVSGFLIMSLLLAERAQTGTVALRAFWARRLRRLFPASVLLLTLVSLSALFVSEQWERTLRGDVVASLFQVANWHFLFQDRDYGDLFAAPSPVLHFWSLAIEEQFYWLFPLVVAGVMAKARRPLRALVVTLGSLIGVAAVLTLVWGTGEPMAVYYVTPVRMGEILAGALLAIAVRKGLLVGARRARAAAACGAFALVASIYSWHHFGAGSPTLYQGGLLIYAGLSTAVVAATTVGGPVRSVLSVEPLRLLGVISYGVYLYHWPIFLLIDGDTGLDGPALLALRLAVTLAVSIASYRLLEAPIRRGWRPRRPSLPMPALAAGALAAATLVAVVVPVVSAPPDNPWAAAFDAYAALPPEDVTEDTVVSVVVGDSTMHYVALGLQEWGRDTGELAVRSGVLRFGCTLMRGGTVRYQSVPVELECNEWAEELPQAIDVVRDRYGRADAAVVLFGPRDVANRVLPGHRAWHHVGEPEVDEYLRSELRAMVDLLTAEGLAVVWLTAPYVATDREHPVMLPGPHPESDPARMDRFNEIVEEVGAEEPAMRVVDLQEYLDGLPGGQLEATFGPDDEPMRPDGVHLTSEASAHVADVWLGDQVVAAARDAAPPAATGDPATTTSGAG
jgi:peptidoglycan/LPS O-acetylase OafA/YrhL